LYYGEIIANGTVDEIRNSTDERVKQFIHGAPEGPIPFARTAKNYLDEILYD
jgi:phospholipid/cholesterol/gamma-HCH transport system ATP-binding protein